MATRGFEKTTLSDLGSRVIERGHKAAPSKQVPQGTTLAPKPSKYRNVKTVVGTQMFDSRREADYWTGLQARERAGEIEHLSRQVKLPLLAPARVSNTPGQYVVVAHYLADFYYEDVATGDPHIVDAKGVRTQVYKLKKKWLELQDGIVIEEV